MTQGSASGQFDGKATLFQLSLDLVALVTLDVLEVLHEQADELAVRFAFELGLQEIAELRIVGTQAIEDLNTFKAVDVIIVGRGGGSRSRVSNPT